MADESNEAQANMQFGVPAYRTEAYRAIYANVCSVSVSLQDIQVVLGRGGNVLGETKVEEVATVYFSPQQAKKFLAILTSQVQAYEAKYGEISLK